MITVAKLFAGVTFALVQIKHNFISFANPNCQNKTIGSELYASDCSGIGLKAMPKGLGGTLKVLNISANSIRSLTANDSREYSELEELSMQFLKKLQSSPVDFLEPLKKLKILYITGTVLLLPPMILPTSITTLYSNVVGRYVAFVDMSDLHELTYLEIRSNSLQSLPTMLSKIAPLVEIDIRNNSLYSLRYDVFAPYCLLRQVRLFGKSDLSQEAVLHHCCNVKFWFEDHNVNSSIGCFKNDRKKCDRSMYRRDPDAITEYFECQLRNGGSMPLFWILLSTSLILLILVTGGFKLRNYYKYKLDVTYTEAEETDYTEDSSDG